MPKATPEQTRKANRAAAVTAVFVAAFALVFAGLITFLNSIADERDQGEVVISEQVPVNPFYVLLIGSDTRQGTALYTGKPTEHGQVDQRSDVMTLMRVDPRTYKISLLTIPRDTVITDDGEKINSALLSDDPNQVVEAVYELTGLRADYYMMTTFGLFVDLVDALGGVTMDVPRDVEVSDPTTGGSIKVKAGEGELLNGAQALAVARARAEYVYDQDALRQANVRGLEQAIIERVLSGESISIEALLIVLRNDVQTNMDLSDMAPAILDFIDHADEVTIYSGTGPYAGAPREGDELWVVSNDKATWKKVMDSFKHGHDFSQIVTPPVIAEESGSSSAAAASSASASSKSSASKATNPKSTASSASTGSASSAAASASSKE